MLEVFVEPSGYHNKTACPTMGVGSFFPGVGPILDFFRRRPKAIFQGTDSGEISFYQLQRKRKTFLY